MKEYSKTCHLKERKPKKVYSLKKKENQKANLNNTYNI